jgi:hypothetical protein
VSPETILKQVQHKVQDKFTRNDDSSTIADYKKPEQKI